MSGRKPKQTKDDLSSSEKSDIAFPSVTVAYDLAVKSYEFGEKRFQAAESRNEKILGFISSLNLVLIAFLSKTDAPKPKFSSILFIIAFLLGILSLVVGILAMLHGRIAVIDISAIYKGWLHLDEDDFKTEVIIKAAGDFNKTFEEIEQKSQLATLSASLFLLETFFLMIWLLPN